MLRRVIRKLILFRRVIRRLVIRRRVVRRRVVRKASCPTSFLISKFMIIRITYKYDQFFHFKLDYVLKSFKNSFKISKFEFFQIEKSTRPEKINFWTNLYIIFYQILGSKSNIKVKKAYYCSFTLWKSFNKLITPIIYEKKSYKIYIILVTFTEIFNKKAF